jgi:hypothetical protein
VSARVPVATRVLTALGRSFADRAGPLLVDLVAVLTAGLDTVDALVQPQAAVPWAPVYDLDAASDPRLPGQLTGTTVPDGLTAAQQRAWIRDRSSWSRGTPAAMVAAVRPLLTGYQRVDLYERTSPTSGLGGAPWQLLVRVYAAQLGAGVTLAQVQAAAETQRPVGVVMTVDVAAGATYGHMTATHGPTYAAYQAAFPTYESARTHMPENGSAA